VENETYVLSKIKLLFPSWFSGLCREFGVCVVKFGSLCRELEVCVVNWGDVSWVGGLCCKLWKFVSWFGGFVSWVGGLLWQKRATVCLGSVNQLRRTAVLSFHASSPPFNHAEPIITQKCLKTLQNKDCSSIGFVNDTL